MTSNLLQDSPIGRLVSVRGRDPRTGEWINGQGFVPDRLPSDVSFSTPAWTGITAATAALARLDGAAKRLRNPDLVREPLLRREAQSTSALEGTYVPFDQVLGASRAEAAGQYGDLREVFNYAVCADHAFSWPIEQRLTTGLLGQLQGVLVAGTGSALRDAGGLRDRTVLIGARGGGFDDARFIPGPHGVVLQEGVDAWLEWVNDPPALPAVVIAAMAHYQFETLHPFSDGNGRLGRLLAAVHLVRSGTLRDPVLVLSPWLEARRDGYQNELFELSRTGEWEPWVAFFSRAVRASAEDTTRRIDRLFELNEAWRSLAEAIPGHAGANIVDVLFEQPIVTAPGIAERIDISLATARAAMNALVDAGVLAIREPARRGRTQVYYADGVIEAVSGAAEDD